MSAAMWRAGGRSFQKPKGFGKGTVSSIIQDREGMVWFGLLGHGIRKWLGYGDWEPWTTKQGLHSDEIWALAAGLAPANLGSG